MTRQAVLVVLWPAFLLACGLELLVFALVDPAELHWGTAALGLSRQAVYTLGFFVFWALGAASGALTLALGAVPERGLSRVPD